MKNECAIVGDLLPLYAENMVSEATGAFVREHLKTCEDCRRASEQIREPEKIHPPKDPAPLKSLKKKLVMKRVQTIALTVVFVIALLVSAFAVLDAPVYLPYSDGLLTVESVGQGGLLIMFDDRVTDFSYDLFSIQEGEGDFYICQVEAWTSLWDQWFSFRHGKRSAVVFPEKDWPVNVMYAPNDGTEDIPVYSEKDMNGALISLPRLSTAFYLGLAFAVLSVLTLGWFLARKKSELRVWIERIALYPVSYIAAHFVVAGFSTATYALQRNFFLTVFLSLLLYCCLLLVHNILRIRKEIQKTV